MARVQGTGYSVELPSGWAIDANGPVMLSEQADMFIGPRTGSAEERLTRISVNFETYSQPRGPVTKEEAVGGFERMRTSFGARATLFFEQQVDGEAGIGFVYAAGYAGQAITARQVLVARGKKLYFVLLGCPGGNLAKHEPALRLLLDSWRWSD